MASNDQTPWWEIERERPPHQGTVDAEREHLRSELARAWRSYLSERDVHPPGVPYPRAG
jgi:hypothetical protein